MISASLLTITPMGWVGLLFSAFLLLLTSRFGGFNTKQIVRYAQVVTVNCARLIYANQVATNGVVHVIDRVIKAVGSTIQDYLEVEEDLTTLSVSTHFKEKVSEVTANARELPCRLMC